jgi:hypothetical protein
MSQALGMARGATGGLTRLGMALGAGRGIEQQAFDAESQNQTRMAQALAQARLAEAQARKIDEELAAAEAARARTERTAAQRPELLLDSIAGMTGTTRPTVDAVRQFKRTGRMPQVEMPGPPEEGEMAVMGDMQIDPAVQSRVARALGQLAPFMDGGDVDMGKWGQLLQTLQGNNLRDDMIGGQVDPGLVGRAQNAMAGRAEMQIPNNYMGNPFAGTVDMAQPINAGQAGLVRAQTGAQNASADASRALAEERRRVPPAPVPGAAPTAADLEKQFGKPPVNHRWRPDGVAEAIPGSPADAKGQDAMLGKERVSRVISDLRQQFDALHQAKGITDPSNNPIRNVAAGVQSSPTGQALGRRLGTQNQSHRNTVNQLRPQLLQAIMKATGMSARQLDSNAELKLYLSTATDTELDYSANIRALELLEELYGLGAGGGGKPNAPAGGGSLTPEEQAELEALRKQLGRR